MACEDKCRAGEDMDACLNDGVMKLVKPPARTLSPSCIFTFPPFFILPTIDGGVGDGAADSFPYRKLTPKADNFLNLSLSLAFSCSSPEAFAFPLSCFTFRVANSSVGGTTGFDLDRVAVRRVCSREDRIFLNGFPVVSIALKSDVEASAAREDEAVRGTGGLLAPTRDGAILKGRAAVAICGEHAMMQRVYAIGNWLESGIVNKRYVEDDSQVGVVTATVR